MVQQLKKNWNLFLRSPPGRRFRDFHARRQTKRGAGRAGTGKLIMAGGVIVSLLGVILLPLPGPGAVVVAGGLMMLASESIVMARILDWMDRRRATLTAKIRGKCKRLSRLSCFLLGVFVTILLAAGGIASWFWLTV